MRAEVTTPPAKIDGALPAISLNGNQYHLVAYDYDINYTFAEPISDMKDETIIPVFDKIFTELTKKGINPRSTSLTTRQ